ncbi:hypothetical protein [Fulvivirga lutea]|uniref:Uncharacterized protein n=1 Tax=Fulvivirga lutea TaxID=2810512 RepID=A0A974WF54_9BACT|nr:hypothetical protein [Fulvivirga lutea]QSE96574.1 hypothetical protein JR347_13325 [Fulvivirga lutea]
MKSMSDLMLQTHFNKLKEELDKSLKEKQGEPENPIHVTLKKVFNYLKAKSISSQLDSDGQELLENVAKQLDELKKK